MNARNYGWCSVQTYQIILSLQSSFQNCLKTGCLAKSCLWDHYLSRAAGTAGTTKKPLCRYNTSVSYRIIGEYQFLFVGVLLGLGGSKWWCQRVIFLSILQCRTACNTATPVNFEMAARQLQNVRQSFERFFGAANNFCKLIFFY